MSTDGNQYKTAKSNEFSKNVMYEPTLEENEEDLGANLLPKTDLDKKLTNTVVDPLAK